MKNLVIANEDQAIDALKRLLNGEKFENGIDLSFDNWPIFNIRIKGDDFDGTIPTRIMPTILELQSEVNRLYCVTRYGDANLRRLTKEDKEKLELVIKVDKGSSIYETILKDPLYKAFQDALSRMSPELLAITVITFGVLVTSAFMWKSWLKNQAASKELDHTIEMSKLEKEKIEIVAKASNSAPEIRALSQGINELRHDMVTKLKDADSLQIPAVDSLEQGDLSLDINGADAKEITYKKRETTQERIETSEYLIRSADFHRKDGIRIEVQRTSDKYIFKADVPVNAIRHNQEETLKNNGWAKRPVNLTLLVREMYGRITSAKLISVNEEIADEKNS